MSVSPGRPGLNGPHAEARAPASLEAPVPIAGAPFEALPLRALTPQDEGATRARAHAAAAEVCDPEIPVLTIADLGVLRGVTVATDGTVEVIITPTYSGCPAMDPIGVDLQIALAKAGFDRVRVRRVLSPAWTTDWMSEAGKAKLLAYGVAPPPAGTSRRALFGQESVACPRCGSSRTEKVSEFGSTACKSLWRCQACREPFDAFKCL